MSPIVWRFGTGRPRYRATGAGRTIGSNVSQVRDARAVVTAYWTAANDRDWVAFGDLVAEDVVYEGPQSRERVRGRANYVRFNTRVSRVIGIW